MSEISLMYVESDAMGYGRLGVKLAKALSQSGVDLYNDIGDPTRIEHRIGQEKPRHKLTNVACWVSTPGHARGWWEGQHVGLLSMWESLRLPEAMRENLHHFDTVIVPSEQNLELFSEYHDNVRLAYLGIDTYQWKPTPRVFDSEFRFLIGGGGERKGVDLAYKAFRAAFPDAKPLKGGPVPKLIFKSPKGVPYYGPGIEVISGRISTEDEIALYASAHCYLQPSRGEGFGLQPLQAIAQGCPTILTDAHGHKAFSHLGYPLSTTTSPAAYFIYGDAGEWWEPNLDELIDSMRWVYEHYDEAKSFARMASAEAHSRFTWQNTAKQFVDAFDGALDRPYEGPREWFVPKHKLYKTVLNCDWSADIAGDRYQFVKGVTYYEHADVKRILMEGGLLDPSCLEVGVGGEETDLGLTESQVKRVGAYSARHSFCQSCGQQMGTSETKSDLLFRKSEEMRKKLADYGLDQGQISDVMS